MTYKLRIAVLAVTGLLAFPLLASAAHWPNFGGDAGHSGFQPLDQAALPIVPLWATSDSGQVRNSIVTTGGTDPANRSLAYGKVQSGGVADVHIRRLDTGAERTGADRDVDDGDADADAFGPDAGAGVSFVSASSDSGPGQLYVVHNDTDSAAQTSESPCPKGSTNDIAIARFDETSGAKKGDFAVGPVGEFLLCEGETPVTDGYTIESSPVITPALDSDGTRWIYFIGRPDPTDPPVTPAPTPRLFGVKVEKAGSADAVVHSDNPQVRALPYGTNTLASPTLMYLRDPDALVSGARLYVAVPVDDADADVRTYAVGDIADPSDDGPVAAGGPGVPQTISVPTTATGQLPGQSGSGASKAPAAYVAYENADDTTTVRRLAQPGSAPTLEAAGVSAPIEGVPAPALAVTAIAAGDGEQAGRVIVTTGRNLVLLDSADLSRDEALADTGEAIAPGDGFSRNTASSSGGLAFVTTDSGSQGVLSLTNAEPVGASSFTPLAPGDRAIGQPAYSDGFLQFLTDAGVFVYATNVITQPPVADYTVTPNPVRQGETVTFDASASKDPDGTIVRYEWDLDGNGEFETNLGAEPKFQTSAGAPGTYNVALRVTDDKGATGTVTKKLEIRGNQAPTASFTADPNPTRTGRRVTFDGSASKDPDGTIAQYEWDLDGNGSFERKTTTPSVRRTFTQAGLVNAKLRVTDNSGATGEAVQQLVVTRAGRVRARRLTARVTPKRDATLPHRFRTRGRLVLPEGVSTRRGCRGRVTLVVKARKQTISRRTTKLRRDCRYSQRVTFDERERLNEVTHLRFKARFQGNRTILPRQAKLRRARIR